jgi:hypothetical protein
VSPVGQVNTLAYFERLCCDTAAANILINSSLMSLFVRMAKAFKSPPLKIRLASVMGILIRHATYITDEVAKHLAQSGLVDILCTMVQDKSDKVWHVSKVTDVFFLGLLNVSLPMREGATTGSSNTRRTAFLHSNARPGAAIVHWWGAAGVGGIGLNLRRGHSLFSCWRG